MPETGQIFSIFVWFAVAAVVTLGGIYAVLAIRRWAQREDKVETFTFQDLRDMRARGEISEQEFAAMRNTLLARIETDLPPEPPATAEQPPPDTPPAAAE